MLSELEVKQKQQQLEELEGQYQKMCEDVNNALKNYLQQFVTLKIVNANKIIIEKPWDYGNKERKQTYRVSLDLGFEAYKEEDTKNDRKIDWASDFHLDIYDDYIKINCGTCGSYSNKEKGQVSRSILIGEIWKHEQDILSLIRPKIAPLIIQLDNDLTYELERHFCEVENLKWEAKVNEVNNVLNNNKQKYIINYISKDKDIKLACIAKITKITKKLIYCTDFNNYSKTFGNYERRVSKDQVTRQVAGGSSDIVFEERFNELLKEL